jgi:predicted Ser/Thr protein kinase
MNAERWRQVEQLYHSALEREPGRRGAFLAEACQGDEELRREVESLLAQDGSTLDRPAVDLLGDPTRTQLTPGTQLGPYRIEGSLGVGGQAEVYRGLDTRLDRKVAIKISAQQFSGRFEREARAISALNHPHICTLYDVGPNYLVMELVEGETLAARLRKGPLHMELVLRYGAEIADALAVAHSLGIIHRDLKPANIMVTKSGVKVLDFGLAKMVQPIGESAKPAETLTASQAIMGTLAYMAPEQLAGKECDARSDIFSLGLVLYETAMGKRAFPGDSRAALIAEVMRCEPAPLESVPDKFAHVVQRCLAKDPESRWQTARDLKAELEWAAAGDFLAPRTVLPRRAFFPWIAGAAVAGAGGAGLAAWAWGGKNSPAQPGAVRFRLAPPEGAWLARVFTEQSLALSPVGRSVAMVANGERGSMVWIQRLDSLTASILQGTEGATTVFWSPNGEFIGFWAGGKLKKIPAEGGTPLPICDIYPVQSATWNRDGIIVATHALSASSTISVKSGTISPGKRLWWPRFLPGGKHLLDVKPDPKIGGLRAYVAELSTGRETELMPTDTKVTFTPDLPGSSQGHLLFGRSSTLLALRFDMDRLRVAGEPEPVAKDVPFLSPKGWSEFDTSPDGVLIYSTGSQEAQLTWLDRGGRELAAVGDPKDFFGSLRLSPDGKKLAADVLDFSNGGTDIWVYDLSQAQATAERVTFEPGGEFSPVWSPEGARIVFGSGGDGPVKLRVKAVSDRGSGEGFPANVFQLPSDWSSDGHWIFYQTNGGEANGEIWLASVADRKVMPLVQTAFDSSFPALSPNQAHLAFSANDTGRSEIYVQGFQEGDSPKLVGERRRLSRNGGNGPRWRRDGKELFFLSPDRQIMAVAVQQGTEIEFGPPAALFHLPTSYRSLAPVTVGYEVSRDGQKFLVPVRKAVGAPLQVVVNWQAELKA